MEYKNKIPVNVILLLAGIILTIICWHYGFMLSIIASLAIIAIAIFNIVSHFTSINNDINKFLFAMENGDYSAFFNTKGKSKKTKLLYRRFNNLIEKSKTNNNKAESQFQLFSTILENNNQGIIVVNQSDFDNAEESPIQYINDAACTILQIPKHKYWNRIGKQIPQFTNIIENCYESEKKLIKAVINGIEKDISTDINIIQSNGERTYIVSFQDIKDEIEKKEIDAWHNLIRILTHEIMNSLTPINILSEALINMVEEHENQDIVLASKTIKKRTAGLMSFVNDYRALTDIPKPEKTSIKIETLLKNVAMVMQPLLKQNNIDFEITNSYKNISLLIDDTLIEQVLINLITNSIHATSETENPKINLSVLWSNNRYSIEVFDNGIGIPTKNLNDIFIPFFSTRENGSGIGLSLSKNIMRAHGGTLRVTSEPGNTIFTATI